MRHLMVQLKDERRWALLEAVTSTPCRCTLLDLFDAAAENSLDQLEASLAEVRLNDVRAACRGRGPLGRDSG
jgi:alkylhydroperoxidase family enzyme